MSKKLTIITVVFNDKTHIESTIKNVLAQTFKDYEYIIIDGGSTDGTLDIIKKYDKKTTWISEPDSGLYDAMNKGIKLAAGEWLNFLNSGDTFYSNQILENIIKTKNIKKYDLIYGDSIIIKKNKKLYSKAIDINSNTIKRKMGLCHQSVFVRKSIAPFYNLKYKLKAEYNWIIDIVFKIDATRIKHITIPIVFYSVGGIGEKQLLLNLKEKILLIQKKFGFKQTIKNCPDYLTILLRHIKYNIIGKR